MSAPIKPDYFTVNPTKFLADKHHEVMTPTALGAYFRLLCRQWIDGDLPGDPEALRALAKVPPRAWAKVWPQLEPCLPTTPSGARNNLWMASQRLYLVNRWLASQESGKKSAEKRWGKGASPASSEDRILATPMGSLSRPNGEPMHNEEVKKKVKNTPPTPPSPAGAAAGGEGDGVPDKIQRQDPIYARQLEALVAQWNAMAKGAGLPMAMLTDRREKLLRAHLREAGFAQAWTAVLAWIPTQPWMLGKTERLWKVDIDWILKPGKVQQLAEKAAAPAAHHQRGRQPELSLEDQEWLSAGGAHA